MPMSKPYALPQKKVSAVLLGVVMSGAEIRACEGCGALFVSAVDSYCAACLVRGATLALPTLRRSDFPNNPDECARELGVTRDVLTTMGAPK